MGIPDWGTYGNSERGKGPRTKKKRNALRKKMEQEMKSESSKVLRSIESSEQDNR